MSFTEEQLNSSVGYFVGEPGATLQGGEWTIIHKLGWGPRSSTWLAVSSKDPNDIEAIKIFTVAATQDGYADNERDLLDGPLEDSFQTLPCLRSSFYEERAKGKHLALVLHVLGSSVESFRVAHGGSLPLTAVKKIVADVLESLADLQKKKIVHNGALLAYKIIVAVTDLLAAVTAENILFGGIQQGPHIIAAVAASPSVKAEDVTDAQGNVYRVVKSQPFAPQSDDISHESLYLSNFGHGLFLLPISIGDYLISVTSALPEQGDVSSKSDILSLGLTVGFTGILSSSSHLLSTGISPPYWHPATSCFGEC